MVGDSAYAEEKRRQAEFVAQVPCNVFLHGESGTGKDALLDETRRHLPPKFPIAIQPTGNLVDDLAVNELCGHVRGIYTSADRDAEGLLQRCDGGIIGLNEADDLGPKTQGLLLSVVEGREYRQMGAASPLRANVRFFLIAHQPVAALVEAKRMRPDLGFRLREAYEVIFRPLREHMEDVPALAQALLERACLKYGAPPMSLSRQTLRVLAGYDYPGNIRELGGILSGAVLHMMFNKTLSDVLRPEMIRLPKGGQRAKGEPRRYTSCADLTAEQWRQALREHGSAAAAIRALNLASRSLYRRLEELGIRSDNGE